MSWLHLSVSYGRLSHKRGCQCVNSQSRPFSASGICYSPYTIWKSTGRTRRSCGVDWLVGYGDIARLNAWGGIQSDNLLNLKHVGAADAATFLQIATLGREAEAMVCQT